MALRLTAVEALCPTACLASGVGYPTIACGRVGDSRTELLDEAFSPEDIDAALAAVEGQPILNVYTETQHTAPYGNVKYDAAENVVVLCVEAFIAARGSIVIPGPDGSDISIGTLDAPVTTRQHECALDFLESQVRLILHPKTQWPAAAAFRKVAWELREIHSDPQRDSTRSVRFASRTIKFHFKVPHEVWPVAPATGLPEPLASAVALLPAQSSAALLCAALAPLTTSLPAVPADPLQLAFFTALGRVPSPTDFDVESGAALTTA